MASSDAVVKTVAKKLKYYFDVRRLEDGFDLSGVNSPQLDHPPLKSRPTLQYDGLHDRALKHYFSLPEVRVRLTNMGPQCKGENREENIKKKIKKTMVRHQFRPQLYPDFAYVTSYRGKRLRKDSAVTRDLHPPPQLQMPRSYKGGHPLLRSVPSHNISRGEAQRLVNIATKLLVATETVDGIQQRPSSPQRGQSAPQPFEKQKQTKRPSTAKYTWDIHGRRHVMPKPKAYDDSYASAYRPMSASASETNKDRERKIVVKKIVTRPKPKEKVVEKEERYSSDSDFSDESDKEEKPKPAKQRPKSPKGRPKSSVQKATVIHVRDTDIKDEVTVNNSTQAGDSVGIQTERKIMTEYDFMDDEVKQGPWCEYQVYVRTGNRIGASTKADVKLTIYGKDGRTKELLLKDSKRHKIKFQKGKEDLFILAGHYVGPLKKIKIGHDRTELTHSWYLEGVTIYDMHDKRIYDFNCDNWLSGHDGDRRTYRVLPVDRDRAFVEVLNEEEMPESTGKSTNRHRHDSSSSLTTSTTRSRTETSLTTNLPNKGGERRRDSDDSDSDSSSGSSYTGSSSSFSTSSRSKSTRTPRPLSPLREPEKDDFFDKRGPTFTFQTTKHTGTNVGSTKANISVESSEDSRSREEFLDGYKSGLKAAEEEKKKKKETESEERKHVLRGPTVFEAAREGNLSRMQELLQHFPEMKESKDERGWTPLHLASKTGQIDVVKWLCVGDISLNTETPTGYTAMHLAAMNGHVNCLMVLFAMGAAITVRTEDMKTPLYLAAMEGQIECVKWLIANRARFDVQDDMGRTPRMIAEEYGHREVAEFLRVCENENTDPKSGFAQMRNSNKNSHGGLARIDEDSNSAASQDDRALWRDDRESESYRARAGSEDGEKEKVKKSKDTKVKKEIYEKHHKRMETTGESFLDSIRNELENGPEP